MVTPLLILYQYLSNELTYGVDAYAEQQWGQCITLVYSTLDGNLYDCLGVVEDNTVFYFTVFLSSC